MALAALRLRANSATANKVVIRENVILPGSRIDFFSGRCEYYDLAELSRGNRASISHINKFSETSNGCTTCSHQGSKHTANYFPYWLPLPY